MANYRLSESCKYPPRRAHTLDAGLDLFVQKTVTLRPYETVYAPAGVCFDLAFGQCVHIMTRSSTFKKGVIIIPTLIDANYHYEVSTIITNQSDRIVVIEEGTSLAQAVLLNYGFFDSDYESLTEVVKQTEHEAVRKESDKFGSTDAKSNGHYHKPTVKIIHLPDLTIAIANQYSSIYKKKSFSKLNDVLSNGVFTPKLLQRAKQPQSLDDLMPDEKPEPFSLDDETLLKDLETFSFEEILSDGTVGHMNNALLKKYFKTTRQQIHLGEPTSIILM